MPVRIFLGSVSETVTGKSISFPLVLNLLILSFSLVGLSEDRNPQTLMLIDGEGSPEGVVEQEIKTWFKRSFDSYFLALCAALESVVSALTPLPLTFVVSVRDTL